MKRKINSNLGLIIWIAAALFILINYACAATFDLSYSLPDEGGYKLELNPASPYKRVTIGVTSDISTRYEIIQKIARPLTNRDNPGIVIGNNFVMHRLIETAGIGTFNVQSTDVAVNSVSLIYTSNTTGQQTTFSLLYGLKDIEKIQPGYYSGQISFTLRPIGSAQAQVTKYLNIDVNISQATTTQAGIVKPRIEIATPTGTKTIRLSPQEREKQACDVEVKINGRFTNLFTIRQQVTGPLISEEGNQLDYSAVNFVVRDVSIGMPVNVVTPLSNQPQDIYASGPNGQAPQSFVITYGLGDLSGQKAGRYRARLQYSLDEKGIQTKLEILGLEVENPRTFELVISPQDQRGRIEFPNLKPNEPARTNEVIIEIKTNVGKPYQVSQNIRAELVNTKDMTKKIAAEYFKLYTERIETKGRLNFMERQQVPLPNAALFMSDNQGSPDKFKVIYELTCPKDLVAGDYATSITYLLSEI